MKIGLIAGGGTDEAQTTLTSAECITSAAKSLGHTTAIIELGRERGADDLAWVSAVRACDLAFPLIAGLEGLLQALQLPYIGSDPTAAGIGADKGLFNDLVRAWGYGKTPYVRLAPWESLDKVDRAGLSYPVFVKPARLGASIGIARVETRADLEQAVVFAKQHDHHVLVEEGVLGREVEVAAIVGEEVLVSQAGVLVLPDGHLWHSVKAKRSYGRLVTDHKLSPKIVNQLKTITVELARRADVSCGIRVDYFLTSTDAILVGEINCVPGQGTISNFPYLFEKSGIDRSMQLSAQIQAALWNRARAAAARVRF